MVRNEDLLSCSNEYGFDCNYFEKFRNSANNATAEEASKLFVASKYEKMKEWYI